MKATIPYGFCECGCGGATSIAEKTSSRSRVRKGEPHRFMNGHRPKRVNAFRPIEIDGDPCCLISLSSGYDAIVDVDQYEHISPWVWTAKSMRGKMYAARSCRLGAKYKTVFLHHEVLGTTNLVDHKNGNGLDCRRSNMRPASSAENQRNRGAQRNNTTGYKGVSFKKHCQLFVAKIKANHVDIHIGYFRSAQEAALAYNRKAIEVHGEFACLNEVSA